MHAGLVGCERMRSRRNMCQPRRDILWGRPRAHGSLVPLSSVVDGSCSRLGSARILCFPANGCEIRALIANSHAADADLPYAPFLYSGHQGLGRGCGADEHRREVAADLLPRLRLRSPRGWGRHPSQRHAGLRGGAAQDQLRGSTVPYAWEGNCCWKNGVRHETLLVTENIGARTLICDWDSLIVASSTLHSHCLVRRTALACCCYQSAPSIRAATTDHPD